MSKKSTLDFEIEHVKRIDGYARRVEGIYMKAADKAALMTESIKVDPKVPFSFSNYPELRARADKLVDEVFKSTASIITQANEAEWLEACKKNDSLVDHFSGILSPEQIKTYKGRNLEALKAFQNRKVNGLGLSDRVWNYSKQFKGDIEMALDIGLGEGKSAAELSRDVRSYLKEPEKLFRRVRDKHGVLQLSKNAKKYSPGPGVYRSSYKNAMRLTRTETNMAYRTSDYESNQQLDFVVGIEIRRSNHVFACPICEQLKGKYPKSFKFVGWHPQCRCYQVSILATQEEFIKQQKEILAGNDVGIKSHNEVRSVPEGFKRWVNENEERLFTNNTTPYFLKDNKQFYKQGVLVKVKQALGKGMDTEAMYSVKGVYSEERKKLHDKIIKEITGVEGSSNGVTYMLGGAPANGKSALVDSGFLPHPPKAILLDPDMVKSKLPEYRAMIESKSKIMVKKAAEFAHEESSYLVKKMQAILTAERKDFVLDGVNDGGFDKVKGKIEKLKEAGNRVRADYVSLDTNLSVKLAEARAKKTGRSVPMDFILDMNREVSVLVPKLLESKVIDELYLWDTNINGSARLILKQINGKLTILDQGLYDNFLSKAKK